jgi:hypothetical protein
MKLEHLWTEPPAFERGVPTVSDRLLRSSSRILGSPCGRPASFSTYRNSGSPSSSNGPGEAHAPNRQNAGPQAGGLLVSGGGERVNDSSPTPMKGSRTHSEEFHELPVGRVGWTGKVLTRSRHRFVAESPRINKGSLHTATGAVGSSFVLEQVPVGREARGATLMPGSHGGAALLRERVSTRRRGWVMQLQDLGAPVARRSKP